MLRHFVRLSVVGALSLSAGLSAATGRPPETAEELYRLTNVWSVHLKFDAAEWKAMEPKGGGGFPPFGGGPGRGGGPGEPRGGGGPGGPGGGFGGPPPASMFLAPLFLREGDQNNDSKISSEEFTKLGAKWFAAWDTNRSGKIGSEQIATGLNSTMMQGGGGPGRGPGFGGFGGGRGGFNLQGPEGGRNGIAARMGVEFYYVRGAIDFEGATISNIAARYKGNGTFLGSRNSDKKSIKLDLNKFVKGQKLAGLNTINLHNAVTDASYMNEALAFKLYRDAGVPAPRTAYARVNVTAGDEHKNDYFGLYIMVENVDDEFTREYFKTKGGALFKPVTQSLFEDLGDDWEKYKQTYDPKDKPSKEEIARVFEMCKLVTNGSDADFAARLGEFIDIEAFARYMAVTVFLSDLDGILGPGQNFYLYLSPKDQKFHFIAWDQDHSFGQMRGSQEDRERLSIEHPWHGDNRFLDRVFKIEAFKKVYLARLKEFNETIFKPERFNKEVDELAPFIRAAIKDESDEKLERFQMTITGKQPQPVGFAFMREGAKPIKGFVGPRSESIADQLAGKSKGNIVFGFGPGGPGRGGPGGPGGGGPRFFGPGTFLADPFLNELDANKDRELTEAEFVKGFMKLFEKWDSEKSGSLTEEQLKAGIDRDLAPRGMPGPPR